jgi:class 3 adenylate cyclase
VTPRAEDLDQRLKPIIEALVHTRWGAMIYDPQWTLIWVSDELGQLLGSEEPRELGIGRNVIEVFQLPRWRDALTAESAAELLGHNLGHILHDQPDGGARVQALLRASGLEGVLEGIAPSEPPPLWAYGLEYVYGDAPPTHVHALSIRLRDPSGKLLGTAQIYNSGFRAGLVNLLARGDRDMYERMVSLAQPRPRALAILFADLEASGTLSKRASNADYFALIQALMRSIDAIVVENRGIVGKHAGDGVTAFFLADHTGSPSAAARTALEAGGAISRAVTGAQEIAGRAGIAPTDVRVNIGAHWGSAVFVGQLITDGRLEVTALGDEVNECARIQETATGGELLASDALIEQLSGHDAEALGIDPSQLAYETVGRFPAAGEKAIRDAGWIPVARLGATMESSGL